MKDHMRKYFPERFEDSDSPSLGKFLRFFDTPNERRTKLSCENAVLSVLQTSDELRLLTGAMNKYGCKFDASRHLACERCNDCTGGFDPDTNQIVICANSKQNKSQLMATIMHEMIHMFDFCRVKFDFNNLEHVACTEIRAANMTYCTITDRLWHGGPGIFDFKQTHQYCVKDVAFKSIKAYSPETADADLWKVIDKVFPSCYNDLEPFGRRATNGIKDLKQSYRERYYYGYV